jgi:hypothetical protein
MEFSAHFFQSQHGVSWLVMRFKLLLALLLLCAAALQPQVNRRLEGVIDAVPVRASFAHAG